MIYDWDTTEFGTSEIHYAARIGDLERLKRLLEHNPRLLNSRAAYGTSPMLVAASSRPPCWHIVAYLIERGADVRKKTPSKHTLLHMAAADGAENIGWEPEAEQGELAEKLIEAGVPLNAKDESGQTALHVAVLAGDVGTVRVLLKHGANIEARDSNGHTPLHYAASRGNEEIARVLLEHGADAGAVSRGNEEMIRIPLKHGFDAEVVADSRTPLDVALNPISLDWDYGPWDLSQAPSAEGCAKVADLLRKWTAKND